MFLPSESQEMVFTILICVGFGVKLIDILHLIVLQTSYDIFFIDWERPQTTLTEAAETEGTGPLGSSRTVLPPIKPSARKPGQTAVDMDEYMRDELKTQNRVSCWRTLFVANEWNELQTYRKTSTTVQLIFALFLLKVINLEELALKDCSEELFKEPNEYRAPFSLVLRMAIASSVLIGICETKIFLRGRISLRFTNLTDLYRDIPETCLYNHLFAVHRGQDRSVHRLLLHLEHQCVHHDALAVRLLHSRPLAARLRRHEHAEDDRSVGA